MGFDSQIVRFMACSAEYLFGPVSAGQEACTIERSLAQCALELSMREPRIHPLFLDNGAKRSSEVSAG